MCRIISKLIVIILIISIIVGTCACNFDDSSSSNNLENIEATFSYNSSHRMFDDGWVYMFDYFYFKDGHTQDDVVPYTFSGINLRYRYADGYNDGSIQMLGEGNDPAIKRDMDKISELLHYNDLPAPSKDEMLAIEPDSMTFESLDRSLFFDLMQEALTKKPVADGKYEIPRYALLTEPTYNDGCAIQIGFTCSMGWIEAMFIDVLYPTGSGIRDYVQLSDIVDNGSATNEQLELFELLCSISDGIVENNDIQFGRSEYGDMIVSSLKLSRLYSFLSDIENSHWSDYSANQ